MVVSLCSALERRGFTAEIVSLEDEPTQDVISVLDIEGHYPFIAGITPENYILLKGFIARLHTSGILWLTKPCQIRSEEPEYAQILGLARTLRNELGVDFATLELDDTGSTGAFDAICMVYEKFQQRNKDRNVDSDYEYAFSNGSVHIPRFHWISIEERLMIPSKSETPKRLAVGKRGSLKSLHWMAQKPNIKLTGNEVSVEVRAVGMNFKVYLSCLICCLY